MDYQYPDELCHYGIKGMRWGIRRFQNPDGTRTALGKLRERKGDGYSSGSSDESRSSRRAARKAARAAKKAAKVAGIVTAAGYIGKKQMENPEELKRFFTERDKQNGNTTELERINKNVSGLSEGFSKRKEKKALVQRRGEYRKQANRFTDAELKKRVSRLNLEKQFVDLSTQKSTDGTWTRYDESEYRRGVMNDVVTFGLPVAMVVGKAALSSPTVRKAVKKAIRIAT